jgi:hypothetical protein
MHKPAPTNSWQINYTRCKGDLRHAKRRNALSIVTIAFDGPRASETRSRYHRSLTKSFFFCR